RLERAELGGRGSAFGLVLETGEPLSLDDLHAPGELDLGRLGAVGDRAWMGVPIVMYGRVEGVLAVHGQRPETFGRGSLALLEAIGMQAAAALKNAHLYGLAMVDGLTGLFMRRYFDARLAEEIERS